MRSLWHDTWGSGRGPAMRLAPAARLVTGGLLFTACMIAPTASAPGAALALGIALAWLTACGPPWRFVRAVLGIGLLVMAPYFLLAAWLGEGAPSGAQPGALGAALGLLVRGASGLLISAATLTGLHPGELDEALSVLPIPRAVSAILIQVVHQTATLGYETRRVAAALSVRGATQGARTAWRLLSSLPRVWLPRVVDRADRVAAAMELRGFCELPASERSPRFTSWRDAFAVTLAACLLATAVVVRLWGIG